MQSWFDALKFKKLGEYNDDNKLKCGRRTVRDHTLINAISVC